MGKHKSLLERTVVGYDLHYPKYNAPTFNTMLDVIKDVRPNRFIFGGDQFDNAEISHHNKRKPIYKERRSYLNNQEGFVNEILEPLEASLPRGAEKVWIVGNHDYWEYEFVEGHPEFEGWVDRVTALNLAKRGWTVVPLGHAYTLGQLHIIHGEILTGIGNQAGMYPSRKAVELYGSNVLAGHTHAPQSFTKISPVEQKKKHMGWISPILGDTNPAYLENRPTAWLHGFNVIESYGADGFFNLYQIILFEGRCAYGGKSYGPR